MELEEAIKICELLCGKKNKKGKREYKTFARMQMEKNYSVDEIADAIEKVLKALDNSIPKDIVRQKINERKFELQQEYEDFKDDIKLNTLQELYYYKED